MASERDIFYSLVKKHFRGGFNPASIIDRKKFARLAESTPAASWDEAALSRAGEETCVRVGDKFYAVGADAEAFLQNLFIYLERGDFGALFYEPLFREYAAQFLEMGVASVEVLKSFLARFPLACEDDFLLLRDESVRDEIARKLAGEIYVPAPRIAEIFPFIPAEVVRRVAANKCDFKIVKNDLVNPDKLEFNEREWEREIKRIKNDIEEKGYSFFSELDLSETRDSHAEINDDIFKEILTFKFLSRDLQLNGQLIQNLKSRNTIPKIIKDYCLSRKNFTLSGLNNELIDFVPRAYISYIFSSALEYSIRIADDSFVALDSINFDVDRIDYCLQEITQNLPITVKSFTQFSLLPRLDDYEWNTYILYSYCLHFSKSFALISPAKNKSCIGIIYPKNFYINPRYYELAATIVKSHAIGAIYDEVSAFAISHGLLTRSVKTAIKNIISFM